MRHQRYAAGDVCLQMSMWVIWFMWPDAARVLLQPNSVGPAKRILPGIATLVRRMRSDEPPKDIKRLSRGSSLLSRDSSGSLSSLESDGKQRLSRISSASNSGRGNKIMHAKAASKVCGRSAATGPEQPQLVTAMLGQRHGCEPTFIATGICAQVLLYCVVSSFALQNWWAFARLVPPAPCASMPASRHYRVASAFADS